jgi:hypothetical protein
VIDFAVDKFNTEGVNLLGGTLSTLVAMRANYIVLKKSILEEQVKLHKDNATLFQFDKLILRLEKEEQNRDEILKSIYELSFNDKQLKDLIEISDITDKGFTIKKKCDVDVYSKMRSVLALRKFLEEREFINNADFCKNFFTLYETFFVSLAKLTMCKFSNDFLGNEQIDYAMLKKVSFNEEAVIKELVDSKTHGLTRNGGSELIKVCEVLNIKYDEFKHIRESFTEIFYRRHILTHGRGGVSAEYKKHVSKPLQKEYTKDDKLIFPPEYQKFLYETILMVIFQLFITSLYRGDVTDDNIEAIEVIAFEMFLSQNEWAISKLIYNYLRKLKFSTESQYPDVFKINYFLCLKKLNEKEELEKQLKTFNVGGSSVKFKIAKYLLQDKYNEVNKLLQDCYEAPQDGITANAILNWPLFSDYLKSEQFTEFKRTHAADFDTTVIAPD